MKEPKDELPCRYCKQPVSKGDKRCPHCGTFNPSMDVKRTMVWTVGVIAALYIAAFIIETFR